MSIEDFIGLTLLEIQALLEELKESGGFPGVTQATATQMSVVPSSFGNSGALTINMGGVTIEGGGSLSDAKELTDAVEREMRSRRLRGF